jgi:hypothetical protein
LSLAAVVRAAKLFHTTLQLVLVVLVVYVAQ